MAGRLLYLRRPVCIVDMLILSVTLFVVLAEQSVVPAGLEKLRFIQILRLFHIDRQMTTWKLIKKMVERSKYELMAAYYIVFMVFLLLSVAIYTIETLYEDWEQEANPEADVGKQGREGIALEYRWSGYGSGQGTLCGYPDLDPARLQDRELPSPGSGCPKMSHKASLGPSST